jgi:hypothetical protein
MAVGDVGSVGSAGVSVQSFDTGINSIIDQLNKAGVQAASAADVQAYIAQSLATNGWADSKSMPDLSAITNAKQGAQVLANYKANVDNMAASIAGTGFTAQQLSDALKTTLATQAPTPTTAAASLGPDYQNLTSKSFAELQSMLHNLDPKDPNVQQKAAAITQAMEQVDNAAKAASGKTGTPDQNRAISEADADAKKKREELRSLDPDAAKSIDQSERQHRIEELLAQLAKIEQSRHETMMAIINAM